MTEKSSIIKNIFSTEDPIGYYKGKQDAFIDSMGSLNDGKNIKDYSASPEAQTATRMHQRAIKSK